jgi:hypothetical protein
MAAPVASSAPPPLRRPPRSAGGRRAQALRAHGRVVQALLRGIAELGSHRGCAPTALGAALAALLLAPSAPTGVGVEHCTEGASASVGSVVAGESIAAGHVPVARPSAAAAEAVPMAPKVDCKAGALGSPRDGGSLVGPVSGHVEGEAAGLCPSVPLVVAEFSELGGDAAVAQLRVPCAALLAEGLGSAEPPLRVVATPQWRGNVHAEVFRPSVAVAAEVESPPAGPVSGDVIPRAEANEAESETVLDTSWWARRLLRLGDCVEVHGLRSAHVLNGRRGRIVGLPSATSRFEVRLDGDEAAMTKGIMAANLRKQEEADDGG